MIACHTGRGLNQACDCEFCVAKVRHTGIIGSARYLVQHAVIQPLYVRPTWTEWDDYEDWIWTLRRAARKKAREELKQLKQR